MLKQSFKVNLLVVFHSAFLGISSDSAPTNSRGWFTVWEQSYFRRAGCTVVFSSLTESYSWDQASLRCMGPVMPCQRMSHVCSAGHRREGVPGPGADLRHTGSLSSGILMTAGRESLRQRKLSQATSCDRLARNSFMAWTGPQIWKPQHYEAAHGKALSCYPLSLPSSYQGWNEIENTLSAVRDLKPMGASQSENGRSVPWPFFYSNQASIACMATTWRKNKSST